MKIDYKKSKYKWPKFRHFLWRWGFLDEECPYCGGELQPVGYPKDIIFQDYICKDDKCIFNKPRY